jgi:hypothetical protein
MLSIVHVRAAHATVGWNDNSSGETGFKIERAIAGSAFVEVARVAENVTSYVDSNLSATTTYWYRVRAYNSVASSDYSNVAEFTTGSDANTTAAAVDSPQKAVALSRLANLSVRAIPGTGDQSLIVGFVVAQASKPILVRGVGPGLAAYTTAATLQDPALTIQGGDSSILENDNWGGTDRLKAVFNQVGAFPLSDGSRDAALLSNFAPGNYTVLVKGAGSGLAMAEIYEADTTANVTGQLVNLSARAQAGTGDGVLIAGFVITGSAPLRVLVRAAGPTLSNYGVASPLADPQLDLFCGSVQWDHNDNWAGSAELDAAFTEAGAFRYPNPGSKDAALVAILPPGAYTAVVSGVNGATGVALVEVYELP